MGVGSGRFGGGVTPPSRVERVWETALCLPRLPSSPSFLRIKPDVPAPPSTISRPGLFCVVVTVTLCLFICFVLGGVCRQSPLPPMGLGTG